MKPVQFVFRLEHPDGSWFEDRGGSTFSGDVSYNDTYYRMVYDNQHLLFKAPTTTWSTPILMTELEIDL